MYWYPASVSLTPHGGVIGKCGGGGRGSLVVEQENRVLPQVRTSTLAQTESGTLRALLSAKYARFLELPSFNIQTRITKYEIV
jgi:hypothetical protein